MVRGLVPRQPAKTGRQEGAHRPWQKKAPVRPACSGSRQVSKQLPRAKNAKKYDPLAPERVADILKRLDQLYPDVTCALTHKSAWELLGATILWGQARDVNANR